MKYAFGIDIGTTGIKAVVVDTDGEVFLRHSRCGDLDLEFLFTFLDVDGRRCILTGRHHGEIIVEQVAENAGQPGVSSFNCVHD